MVDQASGRGHDDIGVGAQARKLRAHRSATNQDRGAQAERAADFLQSLIDLQGQLARHPDFSLANPNRARSLIGAFGVNQRAFHAEGGAGYRWLADQLIALDALNPQTAAKLLPPLGRWRRFDPTRAALMRAELERIVAQPGLSKDLFEQASKSLEG